jgi:hypothetical protein
MPWRGAWAIGSVIAVAALAVLATGGSPRARAPVRAPDVASFPVCPAGGPTRLVSARDRFIAQAVAVAYVRAIQARDLGRAAGLADAGAVEATWLLVRSGFKTSDRDPSAGRVGSLGHLPLGRVVAARCGLKTLAATVRVEVNLAGRPPVTVLLVRRPDRFLVFDVR